MLQKLAENPANPDSDCPELTIDELAQFKRISEENQEARRKQNVTLRLSPQTVKKAKSLGKGYTAVLSRIIENALNDPEVIRRNL